MEIYNDDCFEIKYTKCNKKIKNLKINRESLQMDDESNASSSITQ